VALIRQLIGLIGLYQVLRQISALRRRKQTDNVGQKYHN